MKLDQHFLINEEAAKLMVSRCKITKESIVIEIGPGNGEVTKFIPRCNLTLVEKDEILAEKLKGKFSAKIITGDGVEELRKRDFDFLISSVPYSIAEPLIRELMIHDFKKAVLILPENFVQNILSPQTSFSMIANNLLEIKIIKELEKTDFEPEPKANSTAVEITKNKKANKVLENVYRQHDKKLKNALREALVEVRKITKKQAREIIGKLELHEFVVNKGIDRISAAELQKILSL